MKACTPLNSCQLNVRSAWLDGEIVVQDAHDRPDFQALQNAFDASRTEAIRYFLFDLPFADGRDLRKLPLAQRRALLRHASRTPADGEGHDRVMDGAMLAISVLAAAAAGLTAVGENRVQEALAKMPEAAGASVEWH